MREENTAMLIHEAVRQTNLTKKAIEYYIEQGLLSPAVSENGYRNFNDEEIECLKKISVLRKLGLGTEDIKAVLNDRTNTVLQKLSVRKEITLQQELQKKNMMEKLQSDMDYSEIKKELDTLEKNTTIAQRLLDSFPGYYGRWICLHFAGFLNEPVTTKEQQAAYGEIIAFLDNAPAMQFPKDVQEYLDETTNNFTTSQISKLVKNTRQAIEAPEKFLTENKEFLDYYYAYLQSDEYKNSPAYKYKKLLKEFNDSSGYYDIFIPAMKILSPAYAEYCRQSELANERLLEQYPEAGRIL